MWSASPIRSGSLPTALTSNSCRWPPSGNWQSSKRWWFPAQAAPRIPPKRRACLLPVVLLLCIASTSEAALPWNMAAALERGLPVALHAGQTPPNRVDTSDYEKRGWLGPKFLICHYLPASERDAETMARRSAPLSFATHSEFRLGLAGDPRVTLLRMRKAGVLISLSFDATSIAPPNSSRRCGSPGTWESRGEARRRKRSRLSAFAM